MMKRMVLAALVGIICLNSDLNAMDALCNRIIGFGGMIESVDTIPVIDKLTNLLPFAALATCCKECPGQTMAVLAGLFVYVLSQNESVRSLFNKYKAMGLKRFGIGQIENVEFDETLFIFDGEDEDDAEEEMEVEDELLQAALFDDEYYEVLRNNKKPVEQLKFL